MVTYATAATHYSSHFHHSIVARIFMNERSARENLRGRHNLYTIMRGLRGWRICLEPCQTLRQALAKI